MRLEPVVEPLHQLCSPQSPGQLFFVFSHCNIISCAHHSLQVCCKCLPCSSNRLLRFTGYEPRALGLSVDCSSVEGPVDVSRTRLDRLGPTYSSCVDYILSHHHLLTTLPAQDQFTAPDRFTRSAPIFAGSLVVVPSLDRITGSPAIATPSFQLLLSNTCNLENACLDSRRSPRPIWLLFCTSLGLVAIYLSTKFRPDRSVRSLAIAAASFQLEICLSNSPR